MRTPHVKGQCSGWWLTVPGYGQCYVCQKNRNPVTQGRTVVEVKPQTVANMVSVGVAFPLAPPCIHLGQVVTHGLLEQDHVHQCDHPKLSIDTCRRRSCTLHVSCVGCSGYKMAVAPPFEWDRVWCINLDRRVDRWERFLEECPVPHVERFPAVDGRTVFVPGWWRAGHGAWGCMASHTAILKNALDAGMDKDGKAILVFEDDATFAPGFQAGWERLRANLPVDWDQLYLGGQHRELHRMPLQSINEVVVRAFKVNRTHAYAVRGRFIRVLYEHLTDLQSHRTWDWMHVDHRMEQLHESGRYNIYAPKTWLVGQSKGESDISYRVCPDRFWNEPTDIQEDHRLPRRQLVQ